MELNPSVKEIIISYMKENNFTSLCNPEIPCGCTIEDLAPCDNINLTDCLLGYTKKCEPSNCEAEECENKTDSKQTFCTTLIKP